MGDPTFDLAIALPVLIPKAIAWGEARSAEIQALGVPLNEQELAIARRVGVAHPERVRVLRTLSIPEPEDPQLREAAFQAGVLATETSGLTFRHGFYLAPRADLRILAHECRHVYQYEQAAAGVACRDLAPEFVGVPRGLGVAGVRVRRPGEPCQRVCAHGRSRGSGRHWVSARAGRHLRAVTGLNRSGVRARRPSATCRRAIRGRPRGATGPRRSTP
jgi:hypothetical protein